MIPGTIFLYKDFPGNHATKDKLLVILNDGPAHVLFVSVTTTSNPRGKSSSPGCNPGDTFHNYFVPANSGEIFNKDTWIQLDAFYPLMKDGFLLKQARSEFIYKGNLSILVTGKLIECAFMSDALPRKYAILLQETLTMHPFQA